MKKSHKNHKMHKKGQFYLLTAIILLVVLWSGLPTANEQKIVRSTFELLRDNFITETPYVVNHAISSQGNLSKAYNNFVLSFIDYASSKQVAFGVAYVLKTESKIEVGNYIGGPLTVETNGQLATQQEGEVSQYDLSEKLNLYFGNSTFKYEFASEPVEFKALFRQIS